jgi:hypothetical protein
MGSVDVTEMAKLRDAGAGKLVTSGTQSNFKMGTGLMVAELIAIRGTDCIDTWSGL